MKFRTEAIEKKNRIIRTTCTICLADCAVLVHVEVSYSGYPVFHSGLPRTVLSSSRTPHRREAKSPCQASRRIPSRSSYPADDQAKLQDYAKSGYDRGRMTPVGDITDKNQQMNVSLSQTRYLKILIMIGSSGKESRRVYPLLLQVPLSYTL